MTTTVALNIRAAMKTPYFVAVAGAGGLLVMRAVSPMANSVKNDRPAPLEVEAALPVTGPPKRG